MRMVAVIELLICPRLVREYHPLSNQCSLISTDAVPHGEVRRKEHLTYHLIISRVFPLSKLKKNGGASLDNPLYYCPQMLVEGAWLYLSSLVYPTTALSVH